METAGWKAVKDGGLIYAAGGVSDANIRGTLVKGKVKIGRKVQIAGLNIHSSTEVDNLCRCRESLRDGLICAHSVAVALAADELQSELKESKEAKVLSGEVSKPVNKIISEQLIIIKLESVFTRLWGKDKFPIRLAERAPDKPVEERALEQSNQIRQWLHSLGQSAQKALPPFLILNRKQGGELLRLCATYPFFSVDKKEQPLAINEQAIRLKIHLSGQDQAKVNLQLSGFSDGDQVLLKNEDGDDSPWVYNDQRQQLWPVRWPENSPSRATALELLAAGEQGKNFDEAWLATVIEEWSDVFEIETAAGFQPPSLAPGRAAFELHIDGSLIHVTASIHAFYGDHELILGLDSEDANESHFPYVGQTSDSSTDGRTRYFTRNLQAEMTALRELTASGFSSVDQQGCLHLRGQNEVLHFHVSVVPRLRKKWRLVKAGAKYGAATSHVRAIRPSVTFEAGSQGQDWFSCEFEMEGAQGHSSISEHEIRRFLATGQNQIRKSGDGTLAVLDRDACEDWLEVLRDCDLTQQDGRFRIATQQRDYIESSIACYQNSQSAEQELKLQTDDDQFCRTLAELSDILRPYQRDGIAWLYYKLLPEHGGGAILADEMGLGKTLQTLATSRLLKAQAEARGKKVSGPMLVVCPTSLIDNWDQEIEKFTPEYSCLLMRGPKRGGHFKNMRFADVVITSYALLIRDIEQYQQQYFRLVVLDEASYIRNPSTHNARSAKKLNADSRLALTGTPVENSVLDIWSISDFVRPGYLGSREEFKELYEKPINSGKASVPLHQRFRRRLEPMILRRTKQKVATDLPEKMEEIVYCQLTSTQKELYVGILRESRNKINQAFLSGDERAARMNMLTALLRLRQICCDSRLLKTADKDPSQGSETSSIKPRKSEDSAKLQLLREMLQEALAGGHRMLIFSQFVSMLKLIREELEQADFYDGEIAYLDGSSQDRAAQVERFQTDENVKVFLISLKAGGYGLNLTAADTVMHFDPWWNPAVEAQATDRAHRIGQSKIVTSYKFIARDTVEEKILKLQQQKRDVFDAAIDDNSPMMRGLNTDDLREILDV